MAVDEDMYRLQTWQEVEIIPAQGCEFRQWARLPKLQAGEVVDMQLNLGDLCDLKALQALEVELNVWIEAEGERIQLVWEESGFGVDLAACAK